MSDDDIRYPMAIDTVSQSAGLAESAVAWLASTTPAPDTSPVVVCRHLAWATIHRFGLLEGRSAWIEAARELLEPSGKVLVVRPAHAERIERAVLRRAFMRKYRASLHGAEITAGDAALAWSALGFEDRELEWVKAELERFGVEAAL